MVEKTAEDYAKIFRSFQLEHEINPICVGIDEMLARLDEFETLLSNIKAETSGITENCISTINDFDIEFQAVRQRVDKLEAFVNIVNTNVNAMEQAVDIAEAELNVPNYSLRGLILKPLMNKTAATTSDNSEQGTSKQSNLKDEQFQGIPIFETEKYFKNSNQNETTAMKSKDKRNANERAME